MVDATKADLLLVGLAELHGGESATDGGYELSELVDATGLAQDRLSQHMALVTALEDLRDRGLVEATATETGSLAFRLTDDGTDRATEIQDRLAETEIVIGGEGRREYVPEAAAEFDRSIPQLVANLTDDGVYYHGDGVEDRVVGRDGELERCRDVFETVERAERGAALFLTGPGGVGKTTLAEDVLAAARSRGFDVVEARGRGTDGAPYHPIRDAVEQLDSRPNTTVEGGLAVEDPDRFRNQRTGLFYEFTRALAPTDDEPPRVVSVDDLHLADSATLAYLSSLAEELADQRLVLLASYRPAEFSPGDAFEEAFDEGTDHVTSLRLSPLDRAGTREVVEQAVDNRGAPDQFVDAVHERTGGNPLFVEETVAALVEAGELDPAFAWYPEDADAVGVPDAVRDAIITQVDALDEPVRMVLESAALIGDDVPVAVLERVVNLPAVQVGTMLDALVEASIFDRIGDGVAFRSEVVRDAFRERSAGEQARYDAIAEAFEAELGPVEEAERERSQRDGRVDGEGHGWVDDEGDGRVDGEGDGRVDDEGDSGVDDEGDGRVDDERDWTATVAAHHDRAGNTADAIEWYRRAGRRAMDVYAHDTAVEHYHSALKLARETDDEAAVVVVNEQLARIYLVTAEFDRAERHVEFARERATDPSRRQRLAALATEVASMRGDYETAVDRAAEGLAIDDARSRGRCELLLARAEAEDVQGAFDEAIETAETALEVATALDADDLVMKARYRLGEIAAKQDRIDAARTSLAAAREIAERLDERHRVASIEMTLGAMAYKQDDREALREHNRRSLEHFEAVGDPHGAALARSNLAAMNRQEGDFETARERHRRTLETLETLGDHHGAARARGNLASISFSQGDYETAREYYERALTVFEEVGERRECAMARTRIGEVALAQGQLGRAREYFQDAGEAFEEMGKRRGAAETELCLGIVDVEEGNYESARERITAALAALEAIGNRSGTLRARLALAHLDAATGSPGRSLDRWDEIAEDFEVLDPSYSVEPFERIIRACQEAGDPTAAAEWCDRALEELGGSDGDGLGRLRNHLRDARTELGAERERE